MLANPARPRLIVLSGEGGMGRSAFLARLAFAAQIEGYVTSELRCFPEHPGELAVLRTLVAGLARRSHAPPAMARKATRLVKEAAAASDPPARRHAIRELASTLPRLAGDRPWVLLIDDAHFAPSILLELLAEIVRDISAAERDSAAARPMQVHLVLSIRSEPSFRTVLSSFDSLLSSARATTLPIELEPLSGEEVDRWLERSGYDPSLAPSSQLPSALSGNPFAVREALRLAGDGVSALSGRDANADLHRRYLDSLDAEARELLEILCVIGRPSTPALLATIAGKVEAAIESRAALLLGEGTLVAHGGELAFRHGSLPLRIRALLPEAKARALHGRIARALEARGASLDEVARHALRSDRPHASVDLALSAARALAHKHRDREALRLYEPILELLPSDDSARR
ncbi:MAG TPA: AAA family ATPase, partial [Planctomycetota bacterium]|nr:AAA family ATPase [Planctomycetota bacterium]